MTRKEAADINSKIINCFNTKAQSKLYRKYVEICKPLEEHYKKLIESMRISCPLATPPTPVLLPNDIPLRPKCMDCCKEEN